MTWLPLFAQARAPGSEDSITHRPLTMITASTTSQARSSPRAAFPPRLPRRALGVAVCVLALAGLALAIAPVQPAVEQYLAAAARDRANQRYDLALDQYSAAHAAADADPRPLCATAEVRVLQREWPAAITAYHACLARDGANGGAWLALGDALAASGDNAGAAQAWQRAAAHGARDGWRRLAAAQEAMGDVTAAARAWARLPRDDPQALAHLGLLALWRGELPTAQADLLSALERPGADLDAIRSAGFLDLASARPQPADWQARLGFALLSIGLPRLALDPLRQALAADASTAPAHAYLGWALWLTGDPTAGAAEITAARDLDPQLSFAWFATGEVAAARGDLASADTALRQALTLDDANSAIWTAEAHVLLAQRDYFEADLAFGNAAHLSNAPGATVEWLQFYLDLRYGIDDQRALTAAQAAVRRWPQSEPIRFQLAEIYEQMRQPAFSFYAATQARALDPTDPGPHVLLGQSALRAGDLVAAALELRTALALRPGGPLAGEARDLLAPIADIPA